MGEPRDPLKSRHFLATDAEGRPAPERVRVCVAILLWEIAAADGAIEPTEIEAITRLLDREFELMDDESNEILSVAKIIERERKGLDAFIGDMNRFYSRDQREHMMRLVEQVAIADQIISEPERECLKILRSKLLLEE